MPQLSTHSYTTDYIWTKNKNEKRPRTWVLGVKSDLKLSFYFEWPKKMDFSSIDDVKMRKKHI